MAVRMGFLQPFFIWGMGVINCQLRITNYESGVGSLGFVFVFLGMRVFCVFVWVS